MLQINQSIQDFSRYQGEYEGGKLDVATFEALLAWETTNREAGTTAGALTHSVDFPGFVSDLIDGVFDAHIDAAIKQMDAYVDLMRRSAAGHYRSEKRDGDCGE